MRAIIKKHLKSNKIFKNILSVVIYGYLRFVYLTTRWEYIFSQGTTAGGLRNIKRTVIVTWHDGLAIVPYSLLNLKYKMNMLASPHSDGTVIASVLRMMGFSIIEGSTNRNSFIAVKNIMKALSLNENIAITPDGPRGPRHKINSNIIEIARRSEATIIPISCVSSHYFGFNSWDRLMFPLPFGRVKIFLGSPIIVDKNIEIKPEELEQILNNLRSDMDYL